MSGGAYSTPNSGNEEHPEYWSAAYSKNLDKLSPKQFGIKVDKDVMVELKSGYAVCLDIYRPDNVGKFPVIVTCSPYSKDVQVMDISSQPFNSPMFDHQVEAGDVNFFVERGYAYIVMDAPGTGKSEGAYRGPYSEDEQGAISEVIEWAAQQSWSDGRIGMNGISHFGIIQLLVAAHKPKGLEAIFPVEISVSEYDNIYNEGILNSRGWFIEVDRAVNNHVNVTQEEIGQERYRSLINEVLRNPEVAQNSYLRRMLAAPQGKAFFVDCLLHPLDDVPFWNTRSPLGKLKEIKIPTYLGGIWTYHSLGMAMGPFRAYNDESLDVPKKLIIYANRGEYSLPYKELNWEILRWYDHWLKDIDTGMMEEPPIKTIVNGGRFRYESEWPPKRTRYDRLYLRTFGRLLNEPEDVDNILPEVLIHNPPVVSNNDFYLTFQTPPFKSSFEMTGFSLLKLYCSIDTEDANFVVRTYEVGEGGKKKLLQNGYLKASHWKIKESSDWMVIHDHSRREKIQPGQVAEYTIQLSSVSRVIKAGHSIELQIDTQNITKSESYYHKFGILGSIPSGEQTVYKIYRDLAHLSYLQIPVVPYSEETRWIK